MAALYMLAEEELARFTPTVPSVCAIGVFDGLHVAHQSLIQITKRIAQETSSASLVVVLHPHPRSVLVPGTVVPLLSTLQEREAMLREQGVEVVVPVTFTHELSVLSAREFMTLLRRHLRLSCLVGGPDFALGHRREGTIPVLQSLGEELGYTVEVVSPVVNESLRVSSTLIRRLVAEGDMDITARLLGHCYSTSGVVIQGEERGKLMGYPTANLAIDAERAFPGDGIYATRVHVAGATYSAATYIGSKPMFEGKERLVEAFLLDFVGNLYGKELRIEWVRKLRDDMRFPSVSDLQAQMAQDIEQARAVLGQP